MGKIIFFIVLFFSLLCSCSFDKSRIHSNKCVYSQFYNYANGKENWMIDTLFEGIEYIDHRYKNSCLLSFLERWDSCQGPGTRALVFIKNKQIYIPRTHIDSFEYPSCIDKRKFKYAEEIVRVLDEYDIESLHVGHAPKYLHINFIEQNDTIVSMTYSEESIKSVIQDSFFYGIGWTINKVARE